MSNYVWGSGTYAQYLQTKGFVDDIKSATATASRSAAHNVSRNISMEISKQTLEVIASNEALEKENIRVIEDSADRITDTLNDNFERLSYELADISSGINKLNATFHWGFGQIFASLGHMNDKLSALIKIAKTPVQTMAYNHFEIASDAFRQGFYKESLDELETAINGDHTSAGYKFEWRFHQMKGLIYLGFDGCDKSLINLSKAEESFLLAARFSKTDYPEDSARAFLSAGWAAYCQGRMNDALTYTEQAINLNSQLGEAFFQRAKIYMSCGNADNALSILEQAISLDRFYALKAAGDGDFQKYDSELRAFFDVMRKEKYRITAPTVKKAMDSVRFWLDNFPGVKEGDNIKRLSMFLSEGSGWPLVDILQVAHNIENTGIITFFGVCFG